MFDCMCEEGRKPCVCGKLCQRNSDNSDPNVAEALAKIGDPPPCPWTIHALALAVAAVAGVIFFCALAGYIGTRMGWVS